MRNKAAFKFDNYYHFSINLYCLDIVSISAYMISSKRPIRHPLSVVLPVVLQRLGNSHACFLQIIHISFISSLIANCVLRIVTEGWGISLVI